MLKYTSIEGFLIISENETLVWGGPVASCKERNWGNWAICVGELGHGFIPLTPVGGPVAPVNDLILNKVI